MHQTIQERNNFQRGYRSTIHWPCGTLWRSQRKEHQSTLGNLFLASRKVYDARGEFLILHRLLFWRE
uniref:Uncharacterized protein n=1 Tax=Meloidogyne enterolobii TaxID=390850 RepID=A0A6V7UQ37_MELEN|nr:unnamed protein product [Meloidogyne enterolobii]